MKFHSIILLLFFLFHENLSAQDKKDIIVKDSYENYSDLKSKAQKAEIDTLYYLDPNFGFKVIVPKWLNLQETNDKSFWGGTLPKVEGIENAIIIKSFSKNEFNSFENFRKYVIEDSKFGQAPKWSNSHIFMGKKDLEKYNNFQTRYKTYLMFGKRMYHCQYVLLETLKSFLWIDFTATPETYNKNESKFEEFLNGFESI